MYDDSMYKNGIMKVIDIFDLDTGDFISHQEFCTLNPDVRISYLTYYSVITAIPRPWRRILRQNQPSPPPEIKWPQKFDELIKKG